MADRFDLEQGILGCWNVTADLQLLYDKMDDLTPDERMNILLGIISIYNLKFDVLFQGLETLIQERKVL